MKKGIIILMMSALCLGLTGGCGTTSKGINAPVATEASQQGNEKEVSAATGSFSEEEYQKLQDLQLDDYQHMKISEFQNKIWEMTDTQEYRELLNRFSKDETLYEQKDNDETAAFLFYILEPLTAEKWQSRTYNGAVISEFPAWKDNAILEYAYTLTILDADKVMVKDYNDIRLGVEDALLDILKNRTKEELQNEALMLTELGTYIDDIASYMQTPEVSVDIEYAYFPISAVEEKQQGTKVNDGTDQEARRYTKATKSDYRSLLALKTADYQNMSLADFNAALLEWANEDYERMERIDEAARFNDFLGVSLSDDERSFIKLTVFLSGKENAKYVQSVYNKTSENDPGWDQYLPQRATVDNSMAAWCSLYYQFTYNISDKETVTVGERDRQIEGLVNAVQDFWEETDMEDLLKMSEADIVVKLREIASAYSTDKIAITISEDGAQFECVDEREFRD